MMDVMGIIFSDMQDQQPFDLTAHRCMGSIPVGGRYRLIDFLLSSFANSGVEDVGVITKTNYQSLMDHLGSGREWDLARKTGGLVVLPPFGRHDTGIYQNRVEALHGIMDYMCSSNNDYVIIADCNIMMNASFSAMFDFHQRNNADITVLYQRTTLPSNVEKDTCTFVLEADGKIRNVLIEPVQGGEHNVYLQIMLLSKALLTHMINDCFSRNRFHFERDILQAGVAGYKIYGFEYTGFMSRISTLQTYFSSNLALLDDDVRHRLFPRHLPVYTKVRDEAPVRYGLNASVRNSLLADGCIVEGEVENSVIFRGVNIGKGAKIKNSIVMQGTNIGRNSSMECVVTDKNVTILEDRNIAGFHTYPVYIAKGSVI